VYALLVHALVIAGLVVGIRWSSTPIGQVETTIQATVTEDPEKKKIEDERRRAEEERRKAEAERKRQEAEAQRKQEQERRAEEKRQKEEAEKQRLAEQKRKQEEEVKRREEERKKAEAEAERKRQQTESENRTKAAAEELKHQLETEEKERAEAAQVAARQARAAKEFNKYKALIQQKVTRNWIAVGTSPGLECLVSVRLSPGGEVLEAKVIKGSGNPIFDRSVPPAVYKSSPLPIPPDPDLFEDYRELTFTFRPQ
jgi:colicin import membrane protein